MDSSGNSSSSRGLGKRQPSVVSYSVWFPRGNGALGLRHDERRPAHRLDSSRDEQLGVTCEHRMAGGHDRREPGGAESVQGDAGDRIREPGEQRRPCARRCDCPPRPGSRIRSKRRRLRSRDAGPLDCGGDADACEVVRTHAGKHAAIATYRRADSGDDDRPCHARRRYRTQSISTGSWKCADRLAAAQELGHGLAALVAVVLCQFVHVHGDETVGDSGVDPPAELERVLEGLRTVVEPAADRLAKHLGDIAEHVRRRDRAGQR